MWEILCIVPSVIIIYLGFKMLARLCSYTPWGCYYRGDKPLYVIVVTNKEQKSELIDVLSQASDDLMTMVIVNDTDPNSEFSKKSVSFVRSMIDKTRKEYHIILLLETSIDYADRFRENFKDVQICEDIDALEDVLGLPFDD